MDEEKCAKCGMPMSECTCPKAEEAPAAEPATETPVEETPAQ